MQVLETGGLRANSTSFTGVAKTATHKKRTGAHFTPPELACFVAERIIEAMSFDPLGSIRVLDPACGNGELLLAFARGLSAPVLARTTLSGVELDSAAIEEARKRLDMVPIQSLELQEGDFLTLAAQQRQYGLFDTLPARTIEPAQCIIANPPYVRTQVLGARRAQELAGSFALSGRVDLYHAFLVAMTRYLIPDGILGVVTSNRFLSTKSGSSVREFLDREYDIIEIVDLGDTKLFEAAVLPAVFVGKKRARPTRNCPGPARQTARFVRIYEQGAGCAQGDSAIADATSVCDAVTKMQDGDYRIAGRRYRVATGPLSVPKAPSEPWGMATSTEQAWLQTVEAHAMCRIRDVATVRVGVKTCADNVFIRTDWDSLPADRRPERNLLRHLLSHEDAGRWTTQTAQGQWRRIAYTHEMQGGRRKAVDLQNYPKAAAYFELHRRQLEGRAYVLKAKRHWYEIWVPQQPDAWHLPKIVFPDISAEPKFFFDDQGCLVDGNCYWITVKDHHDPDLLFLIQAVANSKLMTHYHDVSFNNKLYAGRRRYLTQYVEKYPLPDPALANSKRIISLTKELVLGAVAREDVERKERELDVEIAGAFGVTLAPYGLNTACPA